MNLEKLNALADKYEEFSYVRQFTAEELAERKDDLVQTTFDVDAKDQELKDFKANIKAEKEPLLQEIATLKREIKLKGEEMKEKCIVQFNHETNEAEYYSPSTAELVYSRPLMASERQASIKFDVEKTGTNN